MKAGVCSARQADAAGVSSVGCQAIHYTGLCASIYGVALGDTGTFIGAHNLG
eukprot:jgi/Botrbrau1/6909/Bobra.67_3s0027.1